MFLEKVHVIKTPYRILIGKGAYKFIPQILEELASASPLLVCGPTTYEIAGKEIEKILKKKGIRADHIIVERASFENVKSVVKKAKAERFNVLLGIGGGKNIDVAKTSSHYLKIPYLSIPTAPSHDGIASPCSSILKKNKKYSLFLEPPSSIIVEMEIMKKSPLRFFSAGAGDVIAKYTAVTDWEIARERKGEYYGEYAANLARLAAEVMLKKASYYKKDYENAVRLLIEALISCGYAMCIAGSSRPCSGSEHLFAHAIDFFYPENKALHGEKVALGCLISSYLQEKDFELVRKTLTTLKLPRNYKEIKIPKEILIKSLAKARKMRKRYTVLDELKIKSKKQAEKILKKLEII